MEKYTVALTDGTVGTMNGEAEIGQEICIDLHDENGCPIKAFGILAEVLS